jgi:hypothetical protein
MDELDDLHRAGLKFSQNGVEEWCDAIMKRFKDSPNEALSSLLSGI